MADVAFQQQAIVFDFVGAVLIYLDVGRFFFVSFSFPINIAAVRFVVLLNLVVLREAASGGYCRRFENERTELSKYETCDTEENNSVHSEIRETSVSYGGKRITLYNTGRVDRKSIKKKTTTVLYVRTRTY